MGIREYDDDDDDDDGDDDDVTTPLPPGIEDEEEVLPADILLQQYSRSPGGHSDR